MVLVDVSHSVEQHEERTNVQTMDSSRYSASYNFSKHVTHFALLGMIFRVMFVSVGLKKRKRRYWYREGTMMLRLRDADAL